MYHFTTAWERAPRAAPEGVTLLAVGDVHGCAAALDAMLATLATVIDKAQGRGQTCHLIMLGDYVDRGPDSPGVLQRLVTLDESFGPSVPVHLLRGNHDQMLLDHLRAMPHPGTFELWLMNGGSSVLAQLGIFEPTEEADAEILADLSGRLRARLGPAIVDLLRSTRLIERIGDYLFVHAGVAPDRPLDEQGRTISSGSASPSWMPGNARTPLPSSTATRRSGRRFCRIASASTAAAFSPAC